MIPQPTYRDITIVEDASVDDTLRYMKEIAFTTHLDVKELADELKGESDYESCNNIWNWVKANIKYKYDKQDIEEIRTPRRTYHERTGDCDCMTLFISALLYNLNIPHKYKIVAWRGKGNWAHIYPIAQINGRDVAIDCIPESKKFDSEINHSDFMKLNVLAGFDSAENTTIGEAMEVETVLNGYDDLSDDEEHPISLNGYEEAGYGETPEKTLTGEQMASLNDIEALSALKDAHGAIQKESALAGYFDDEDKNTLSGLITDWCDLSREDKIIKLRNLRDGLNQFTSQYEDRKTNGCEAKNNLKEFYNALAGQLEYSKELERIDSLPFVASQEDGNIHDLQGYVESSLEGADYDDAQMMIAQSGELSGLGLFRRKKKSATTTAKPKKGLRKLASKVRDGLKKVVNTVVRYNPATISIRNGILAAMKINAFKIGSRMSYGYLTPEQAQAKGLDLTEHAKIVKEVQNLENDFVKIGGKRENLKKAILSSHKAKEVFKNVNTGLVNGLGSAAAAALSSALPFIKKLASKLKSINFKKLFAKSKIKPTGDELVDDAQVDNEISTAENAVKDNAGSQQIKKVNSLTMNKPTENANLATSDVTNLATDPTEADKPKGWLASTWADKKKRWLLIGGSLGVVLLIVLIVWLFRRSKKKSLSGRRKRRPMNGVRKYGIQVRRIQRKPSNPTRSLQIAGAHAPVKRRKATKRKKTTKKRAK